MSEPADRAYSHNSLEAYAPKRYKDANNANSSARGGTDNLFEFPSQSVKHAAIEGELEGRTTPSSVARQEIVTEDSNPASSGFGGAKTLWGLTLIASAGIAVIAVYMNPARDEKRHGPSVDESHSFSAIVSRNAQDDTHTKLSVSQSPIVTRVGEAAPLGVSVRDLKHGGLIVVRGLPNGARLSKGSFVSGNDWWVSVMELDGVEIMPLPDFVGSIEISIELRLADMSLIDQRLARFEWAGPIEQEARGKDSTSAAARSPRAARQIPPEEMAALLRRGKDLIVSGDLAAARLVLQRAAEAGNAQAAFMIAGTYDPASLQKFRVHGFASDVAMARHWYEKAEELGSRDALGKLKILANQ